MSDDLTMFENHLSRELRSYAASQAPTIAPAVIERAVAAGVASRRRRRFGLRGPWIGRPMVLRTAVSAVVVLAVVFGLAYLSGRKNDVVSPPVSPTATPTPTPAPSASGPSASAPGELVHGWPRTTATGPGLFSWDGYSCAGMFCGVSPTGGFMHNGYGSGDMSISVGVLPELPEPLPDDVGTRFAGYPATLRRPDQDHSEWYVNFNGTTMVIELTFEPGASEADRQEGYAIIESFVYEPRDTRLGFRLVFTLTSNDWDSG
jgi:hypothetical protein